MTAAEGMPERTGYAVIVGNEEYRRNKQKWNHVIGVCRASGLPVVVLSHGRPRPQYNFAVMPENVEAFLANMERSAK